MSPEGVAEGVAWSVAQGVPERVVWCWWQRLIAELVGMCCQGVGVGVPSGVPERVVRGVRGSARSQNWLGGVAKGVGVGVADGI